MNNSTAFELPKIKIKSPLVDKRKMKEKSRNERLRKNKTSLGYMVSS